MQSLMQLLNRLEKVSSPALVDSSQFKKMLECGSTTFWKLQNEDPTFPRPVAFDSKKRWRLSDVVQWIQNLPSAPEKIAPGRKPKTAELAHCMRRSKGAEIMTQSEACATPDTTEGNQ